MRRALGIIALTVGVYSGSVCWAGPGGASGPITVDSSTYVAGQSVMGTDGGFYNSALQPVGSGTTAAFGMTRFRAEHVNLRDAAGTELGTVGNPLYTTASSTITIGLVTVSNSSFSVTGSTVVATQSDPTKLNATVVQGTPGNLKASVSISGSSNTVQATQSGTWNINNTQVGTSSVAVIGTPNVAVTNTPSVTLGAALPAGTNNIGTVSNSTVTVRTAAGVPIATTVGNTVGVTVNAGLPAGTNNVGTVTGSTVTIVTPSGANLPVVVNASLPTGSNPIGQVTAVQATPSALKASVLIDGSSNTVTANQGATPYTINITKVNGTSISGSSVPVTGSLLIAGSSTTASVTAYQGGTWATSITGTPTVILSGTPIVSAAQSGSWTNTVTQGTASNLKAEVAIDSSSNTVRAQQSGTWTVSSTPVGTSTVTFNSIAQPVTAAQSTPASLQASVSINGSSNTVQAAQSGAWTATATQSTNSSLRASVAIDGSSNTVVLGGGTANIGKVAYQTPTAAVLSSTGVTTSVAISTPVAALSSQTVRVFRLVITADAATTITFRDGATPFGEQFPLTANGSIVLDLTNEPWYVTSASNGFVVKQTGSANLGIRIYYTQS